MLRNIKDICKVVSSTNAGTRLLSVKPTQKRNISEKVRKVKFLRPLESGHSVKCALVLGDFVDIFWEMWM